MRDTSKQKRVFQLVGSFRCAHFLFFLVKGEFSPDSSCRCCTQCTDVPALVMRFCVQLLLERGATTPSSLNTVKTKVHEGQDSLERTLHAGRDNC